MKSRTALLIGLALLLAHPFVLQAQIPRTLSYQGIVTDAAGNVKPDATYRFQFEIYNAETGGNLLWGPQTEDLETMNGLFYTQLGPFPASLTFNNPYWLGIIVGGEILSRVPLTSVGYSFSALRADTAAYALSAPAVGGGDITAVIAGSGLTGGGTSGDITLSLASSLYVTEISATSKITAINTGSDNAGYFKINNASNGAEALYVSTNGSGYTLHAYNSGSGSAGSFRISNPSNASDVIFARTDGSGDVIYAKTTGTGMAGYFKIDNASSSEDALYVSNTGTGYAGKFSGTVWATEFIEGSDIRWKRNITSIECALSKVMDLRGVQFEWNREEYPDNGFREGKQIGLIAQEVEKVLPEIVRTDKDGYKAVEYQKITAVLVEAIKEQQQEIDELRAAVAVLQGKSNVALQE